MNSSARSHRLETPPRVEQLFEHNMGFVRKLAREIHRQTGESGLDVDDLVQEGCIGLLSAIDRFDAARGASFLAYAAPAIRNAMTDCARAALSQFERRLELGRFAARVPRRRARRR